jgi:hypothetical protein
MRVNKPRRIRWVGHVARVRDTTCPYRTSAENLKGSYSSGLFGTLRKRENDIKKDLKDDLNV